MSLLSVTGLGKSFGGVNAVDDVSFNLEAGELLALLGPNGAGKSTLFNMVNGQLAPGSGSIRLNGRELVGMRPRDIWRLGVGRTFQIAATFNSMTVQENVQMALISRERKTFGLWRSAGSRYADEALALLDQVGMVGQAQRACGVLAYGDVKRVELAIALANRPTLLLMDEPTAGMAPQERHALMALTRRLVIEHRIGVLFTEHSMDVVFAHADRMIVLARGKLIAEGDADTIRQNPRVQEVYFGTGKTFQPHAPLPEATLSHPTQGGRAP
ncbi:ABC transporter ATP-binding protein [Paraburkholderia sp. BCC1886]|uniref:ABC transporter ATP-binding protein n=1 Tax=Paraburkholderia sp. BCC1886 TaxID=2562670 RepID=UPI001183908F|nr:ABC transporter ATP-binding protein [Paraburkholderia sp. BCC1886]